MTAPTVEQIAEVLAARLGWQSGIYEAAEEVAALGITVREDEGGEERE